MALMADRDHVLRHVKGPPGRIAQMVRFGRRLPAAALALPGRALEYLGADLQEAGMAQVLSVSPVWPISRLRRLVVHRHHPPRVVCA